MPRRRSREKSASRNRRPEMPRRREGIKSASRREKIAREKEKSARERPPNAIRIRRRRMTS